MPRGFVRWLCAAVLACVFVDIRAVRADWLTWSAPPECAQHDAIASTIEARLAQRGERRGELAVSGAVRQRGQEFVLALRVTRAGPPAERSLSAASCEALADAAVLLVMLGIAPDEPGVPSATTLAGAPDSETSKATAAVSPSVPVSAPLAEAQATPAPDSAEGASPEPTAPNKSSGFKDFSAILPNFSELGLSVGAAGFGLPGAQLGGALRAGLAWGPWLVQLELAGTAPRSRVESRVGELRTYGLSAALSGCFLPIGASRNAVWSVAPCLTVSTVRTHAEALDLSVAQARTSYWWLAGLGLDGSVRLVGPLRARLELGMALPLSARPGFSVDGAGTVERAHFVSAFGRAGLGLRF